jgi:AcrR family transcriptional regulator
VTAGKPRADAVRNRARVLDAAETVLARDGLSARMDAIARHAGVGVGTVYRHFPTKEVLYEAIIAGRFERLLDEAAQLSSAGDPGAAFFTFFGRIVVESAATKSFAQALTGAGVEYKVGLAEVQAKMRAAIELLLSDAQRAAAVRAEIGMPEVLALLTGASLTAEHTDWDAELRDRTLKVIFNGLRPAERA